jgi:hypothetical protein
MTPQRALRMPTRRDPPRVASAPRIRTATDRAGAGPGVREDHEPAPPRARTRPRMET